MGTVATCAEKSAPKRGLTRRAFLLRCGGGILAASGASVYARYVEPYWPALEWQTMDLRELAPTFAGLRLIQLSDLHLSRGVPADYLHRQLERCRALSPDLIVLTGDYITRGDPRYNQALIRLLHLLHAPLGVYAVLGNHDCGAHTADGTHRSPALANHLRKLLADCGVTVLRNELRVLTAAGAPLQLVGLDDLWGGSCDPERAFADVDPGLPCIVLAHNPDVIDDLQDKPWDWLLCGHTHGGQVRLPLLGAPILPIRNRQYDAGLFDVAGKRLYVNRGLGHLLPIRINCRPEITLFTLTRRA